MSSLQHCLGGGVKGISVDWGHAPKVTNVASSQRIILDLLMPILTLFVALFS